MAGRMKLAAGAMLCAALAGAGGAQEADDAETLLRAMTDFVTAQEHLSFAYQSSVEAVTDDFQKLEFVSSGAVAISRPDRIRVTRTGGFVDAEMIYDGRALTVLAKNLGEYARIEAAGTLADLNAALENAGLETPASELLSADSFAQLMQDVTEAVHVSSAFIDGVECEYLAFRTPDHDWQIWIEAGPRPVPRRYVITSKHVVQAPQYTLELSDWKLGDEAGPVDVAFAAPADAQRVELAEIELLDELPPETEGAQQ